MAIELLPLLGVDNPYPGLRPFEPHESFLFHGRQEHTRALLDRLATERFLAVVGGSGSGKSSLVRAGLLPALYRGYLVGTSSRWRIGVMRPGSAPLDELAHALSAREALARNVGALRQVVGRTSLGLVEAVEDAELAKDENVLLVVDQFEELFRFQRERRHQDGGAEAHLFVQGLLEAADSYTARIFIVITMRSDYLAQCAQFAGLPEALNRGQYLIPHLTREQRREAIEKPPLVAGARVKPALVQQLLNDMGDDPAQLPVLQHALMRTFRRLRESGGSELDFDHYAKAGGFANALDQHANSIVESLPAASRAWVGKLFKALTTMESGRAVRRPARLDRISDVLEATGDSAARANLIAAIEAFARPENSLLVSSTGLPPGNESVIDISHESLIRNWRQLQHWLREETRNAEWFLSLAGDTLRFRDGDASTWRDPELRRVIQLKNDAGWNEAWARQYLPAADPPYSEIVRFLDESVRTQQQERAEREAQRRKEIDDARALAAHAARAKKFYRLFMWSLVALLVAVGIVVWNVRRAHEADAAEAQAALEMAARIERAESEREELTRLVRAAEQQLRDAEGDGKQDAALRQHIADLEKRLRTTSAISSNAREQLQQNVGKSGGSEYSAALKQVADLQAQLKQTRDERDSLRSSLDTYATTQGRDAGYWQPRAQSAEEEVRRLRAVAEPGMAQPLVLNLRPASSVRLDAAPFGGRAHLFFGDAARGKAAGLNLFVVLPKTKGGPAEFVANDKAAVAMTGRWLAHSRCPGYVDEAAASVWCFDVAGRTAQAAPQQLGRFTFDRNTYAVVASGWAQGTRPGALEVLTFVVHPAQEPRAAAKE